MYPSFKDNSGFTLLEMAIVMVIIGLLAGGGVSLMGMLTERKARNETVDYLKQVKTSLVGFAMNNGRLPWADNNGDGTEDTGVSAGGLPFLTIGISPADPMRRTLTYAVNNTLTTGRPAGCNALRAGLTGTPLVVDADGSPTAFSAAAVLISAGQMDADVDGNVFDQITAGTHQGDNRDGNPNYIRFPPTNTFDDLVLYIGGNALFGDICGQPVLTIKNNTTTDVYVYDETQGNDIGIITGTGGPNPTNSFRIIAGTSIRLWGGPGGTGSTVTSNPPTPIILAGNGNTLLITSVP